MRKVTLVIFSVSLLAATATSAHKGITNTNGGPLTAEYARSVTKDALNTTPHISSKASASDAREAKYSDEMKGPRLEIDRPDLELQLAAIQSELSKGKIFSEISYDGLEAVKASLNIVSANKDKILLALQQNQLPESNLFSEQKKLNEILDKAESDSRLTCVREKLTGSHRVIKTCRTQAEIARTKEAAQNTMRRQYEGKLDAPRTTNE